MLRHSGAVVALSVCLTMSAVAEAQQNFPVIPAPPTQMNLPQVPLNISPALDDHAENIRAAHQYALQQVNLALAYLMANREHILTGRNEHYNSIFGRFYDTNPETNPLVGSYQRTVQMATLTPLPFNFTFDGNGGPPDNTTRRGGAGGGGGQPGGGQQQQNNVEPRYYELVEYGTYFEMTGTITAANPRVMTVGFLGLPLGMSGNDATSIPTAPTTQAPELAELQRMLPPGTQIYIGNPNGGGQFVTVNRILSNNTVELTRPAAAFTGNVRQVTSIQEAANPAHFDQVARTFMAIRDFLMQPTTYEIAVDANGVANQARWNQVFAANNAVFPFLPGVAGHTLGRALRQDGLSTSGSPAWQAAQAAGLPLAWSRDNVAQITGGVPQEWNRYYYEEILTAFGANNNPNLQTLGNAFLREARPHNGADFLQSTPPTDPNNYQATEFRQWQMLIQSFAEHSTNLSANNVAAFGVMEILRYLESTAGFQNTQFLENRDAGNFARFAALFQSADLGGVLGGLSESSAMPGKRGRAFVPFVSFQ